jgi:hypothetical protein
MRAFNHIILVLSACVFLVNGCTSENSRETAYHGTVHDSVTNEPFGNLDVKVTDGENVHSQTKTNADGEFTLTVKIKEINDRYYILVGDDTCEKKIVSFPGYAEGVNELGIIMVEGPKLPIVETDKDYTVEVNRLSCGGKVIDAGRLNITDRGICYSRLSYPTIEDNKVSEGKGEGEFTCVIRNLELGTSYYFRAYATNGKGTSYGEQFSFSTTSGLPVVETNSVSSITATSAKCSGTVINDGGFSIKSLGICWATTPDPTIDDYISQGGVSNKNFTCTMSNLSVSTTYYVRAFATNENGTSYGASLPVVTNSGLPVVSTDEPTSTSTSITITGAVKEDGGFPVTERGICYSTSSAEPTTSDSRVQSGNGNGAFTVTITGLSPKTKYYLRAYAINQNGTTYGESRNKTTTSGLPSVTTYESYESGLDYLVVSGSASSESSAPITRKGVCWSINSNPSVNDGFVVANTSTASFSCRIEGLQSGTTYYCRAFAENAYGIAYGSSYKCKTKYASTTLTGHVYDQDGSPISGAYIQGYDISSSYNAKTDNSGYYTIDMGSMSGQCRFTINADGYKEEIQQVNLTKGQENKKDFYLTLENSFAVDFGTGIFANPGSAWEMYFECTQSSLAGTTTTRNMRIKNYRSVPVTWSLSNIPSTGVVFSQTSGSVSAKGEISIKVTFTYPSASSLVVQLTGCSNGTKTYIWNWEAAYGGYQAIDGNIYPSSCNACCWHNPIINIDGYTEAFTILFNQYVAYK